MSLLKSLSIEVTRFETISIVKGRHVPSSDTKSVFNISCTVQPLTGKELETLPEIIRSTSSYKIFTETELKTTNEATGLKADRLNLFGSLCQITKVMPWQSGLINHYECIASEINDKR